MQPSKILISLFCVFVFAACEKKKEDDKKDSTETPTPQIEQGAMGPQGNQGPQGPAGPAGPQGPQGPQGPIGPMGLQGVKGDKGDTGSMGSTGATGAVGPAGAKGDRGEKGDQGIAGVQGVQGEPGAVGSVFPVDPVSYNFSAIAQRYYSPSIVAPLVFQLPRWTAYLVIPEALSVVPGGNAGTGWATVYVEGVTYCYQGNASSTAKPDGTTFVLSRFRKTPGDCWSAGSEAISGAQKISIGGAVTVTVSIAGGGCTIKAGSCIDTEALGIFGVYP